MSLSEDVLLAIERCLLTYGAVECAHGSRVLKQENTADGWFRAGGKSRTSVNQLLNVHLKQRKPLLDSKTMLWRYVCVRGLMMNACCAANLLPEMVRLDINSPLTSQHSGGKI